MHALLLETVPEIDTNRCFYGRDWPWTPLRRQTPIICSPSVLAIVTDPHFRLDDDVNVITMPATVTREIFSMLILDFSFHYIDLQTLPSPSFRQREKACIVFVSMPLPSLWTSVLNVFTPVKRRRNAYRKQTAGRSSLLKPICSHIQQRNRRLLSNGQVHIMNKDIKSKTYN